jgi:hypothetical protein
MDEKYIKYLNNQARRVQNLRHKQDMREMVKEFEAMKAAQEKDKKEKANVPAGLVGGKKNKSKKSKFKKNKSKKNKSKKNKSKKSKSKKSKSKKSK